MHPDMQSIHCTIMRGGTSKGIFIMKNQLPAEAHIRDKAIQAVFGSPDMRQIDGLGGADALTSKLAIIGPPTCAGADVDYTFAQVGITQDIVDYGGNCGNISSGVGPYAIDMGLVAPQEPITTVRIHQTNTNRILVAQVPVKDGKALAEGDCMIDGVPGMGARITLDFSSTVGSATGRLLPAGQPADVLTVDGRQYEVSVVDAGIPVVFIAAQSLGLCGTESVQRIDSDAALLQRIEAIRGAAAVKAGLAETPEQATRESPYAPFFAIVSKPAAYDALGGKRVEEAETDLVVRLLFMQKMHKTYPGTGAVCTGAAVRIPGSIACGVLRPEARRSEKIRIGHPSGVMTVESVARQTESGPVFERLAFYRTARMLMDGTVYIKNSVLTPKQ